MKWRVYYLYSKKLSKYYIGKTNDLKRRLKEHNNREETYTKLGVPWILVGYIDCENNKQAINIEHKLKKSKNKKYVKRYIENNGIIII